MPVRRPEAPVAGGLRHGAARGEAEHEAGEREAEHDDDPRGFRGAYDGGEMMCVKVWGKRKRPERTAPAVVRRGVW